MSLQTAPSVFFACDAHRCPERTPIPRLTEAEAWVDWRLADGTAYIDHNGATSHYCHKHTPRLD